MVEGDWEWWNNFYKKGEINMGTHGAQSLAAVEFATAQRILAQSISEPIHNLLANKTAKERKQYPVKTGFMNYFRDAIFRVAHVSYLGNEQHNPGEPLHWARGKSMDQGDCEARHMLCDDEEEHMAAKAWRALADLQIFLEKKYNIKPPAGAR